MSPDYMPVAGNDTVAIWILDQVRRDGSLEGEVAVAKVQRLFGPRFTTEPGDAPAILRKGVLLAVRDLSRGAIVLDRKECRFRPR